MTKEGEDHVSQPAGCDLQDDSERERGAGLWNDSTPTLTLPRQGGGNINGNASPRGGNERKRGWPLEEQK